MKITALLFGSDEEHRRATAEQLLLLVEDPFIEIQVARNLCETRRSYAKKRNTSSILRWLASTP